MTVTGDQVRDAMLAAGMTRVDHHDCCGCGYMTAYLVIDGELYFDPGCDCGSYNNYEPRRAGFAEAADWINIQTNEDVRTKLMQRFGFQSAPQER